MATVLPQPQAPQLRIPQISPILTIAIGFGLIEIALWLPKELQVGPGMLAFLWIIGTTAFSGRSREEIGLGRRGFRESAWVAGAATAIGAVIIFIGWIVGSLHALPGLIPPVTHALAYAVWAFQQEFILQSFLFLGLVRVTTPRRAVFIAAALFSFAHVPNPILVCATFASGLALTAAFARYRNVYPLAIAHAVLGLAVAVALPADLHRNMRVGIGYFTYRPLQAATAPNTPSTAPSASQAIYPDNATSR